MNSYLKGAIGGTVATIFHSVVMLALHPGERRRSLPPVQITAETAERLGTHPDTNELLRAATAAHFGFGAVTGSLFIPLLGRALAAHPLAGIGYGVGVWALSYYGWVPALRLMPPASRHSAQRNLAMILAHVAWGAALSLITRTLEKRRMPVKAD
jgi:uncharacterized membrane protein YagU involved in acid resistance